MAEVGALRVSLALDSADFSRSMTDVNTKLRGLRSEMNVAKSGGREFQGSLEGLRSRSDILSRTFDLQSAKVSELRARYDESVATKGRDAQETQKLLSQYNNAVAAMNRTEQQLKAVTAEIERQTNPWRRLETSLSETGKKFQDVGKSMSNVGKDLSMKVTAPIVGLGAVMLKTGMDFESSMSNVAAISGATGRDFDLLSDKAREMGAGTSKSASEAADAMGYMALAGWDTQQMLNGIEPILRLSEAGNIDLARASDLVTDSMAALGVEVQDLPHYLDQVAQTARNSNTDIDALMEAFLVAGGTLASFNVPLEEANALLGIMANRGFKGSEAGRALNAIFTNLTSGAGQAGVAMDELNLSAFDSEGNFKGLEAILREVGEATSTMTDEQRAQYISMIAGKEHMKTFQALMAGLGDEYDDLKNTVIDSNGALEDMALTMQDNAAGRVKEFRSALEELSIMFSAHILPVFTAGVEGATELARKFAELDPKTQKLILGGAALAAAIGPVVWGLGNLTSGIGGAIIISGKLAGVIAGAGGLGAALTTLATGPVGITVAAIAGLTAGGVALYQNWDTLTAEGNHLGQALVGLSGPVGLIVRGIKGVQEATSDAIPEIELFSDEISESTQEAVGAFLDLNDEATVALNELSWSGKEVSGEMKETIVANFDEMGAQIVEGLGVKRDEAVVVMQDLFAQSTQISEEEQQKIIENVTTGYDERIVSIEEGNARIKEIMETAAEENRGITQWEQGEINRIQQEMVDTGIRVLTENEMEQKVILERMQQQSSEITARQAAEVVKNSVDQKNKVVAEAEEQYNKTIAEIIRQRDETGTISAEQADLLIQEATRQRDETVRNAEEMHQSVLTEAKAQAEGHVDQVDWETGEVLSKWQVFKNNTAQNWSEMVENSKQRWNEMGNDIRNRAEEIRSNAVAKFNQLRDDARTKFIETKENMLRPVREAKEDIGDLIDDVKSFFTNLKLKFPKIEMPALPRFSLQGNFSLNPPSVPRLNVDWYANGGFFDRPSIIGIGEAGKEAAVPLVGRRMDPFADAVFNRLEERLGSGANGGNVVNFEKMFDGAIFHVRSENDARLIAREIHRMQRKKRRGEGI